jgi:hypothetical protein
MMDGGWLVDGDDSDDDGDEDGHDDGNDNGDDDCYDDGDDDGYHFRPLSPAPPLPPCLYVVGRCNIESLIGVGSLPSCC